MSIENARDLERALEHTRDLARALKRAHALAGARDCDLDRDRDHDLAIALDRARVLATALDGTRDLSFDLIADLVEPATDLAADLARALGRTRDLDLARDLATNLALARVLARDIVRVCYPAGVALGLEPTSILVTAFDSAQSPAATAPDRMPMPRRSTTAQRLLAVAVWLLPASDQHRYRSEFRSELEEIALAGGGRLTQLAHTARVLRSSVRLRAELKSPRRQSALP